MPENHFLDNVFKSPEFTREELEIIIPKFKQIQFSKGDYLLKEGQTANHYWFIQSGFFRSYASDTEGNDITTDFYTVGDIIIDWSSFFLRQPTRENTQALSDGVGWQLDFETFQQLFHSIPTFREQGRTRLVSSYFALKKHSISMIADEAKERYLRLMKQKPQVIQNVSLKHIATYLGITDTSLSRIRKEISSE
jgi:CRP-like cAMP-binding protein